MFEFSVSKQELFPKLLIVSGAIGKKITNPYLSHILLKLKSNQLILTATDLEMEISARIECLTEESELSVAVPAKKLIDIVRSLDDHSSPSFRLDGNSLMIQEGRSLFKLATLSGDAFPKIQDERGDFELSLPVKELTKLLQLTIFAVSQQDVRVFLNCLMLDFDIHGITAVGTDGHRMAIAKLPLTLSEQHRLLLSRRSTTEILRLLALVDEEQLLVTAGKNYFRLETDKFTFVSKLIESRFPVYTKAIPIGQDKHINIQATILKRALNRMIILAHEKSKGILLHIQPGLVTLVANNQEKEEAMESLEAETFGEELKIGLNAGFLLDVLNCFDENLIQLSFSTAEHSILVTSPEQPNYQYIIMPMKL